MTAPRDQLRWVRAVATLAFAAGIAVGLAAPVAVDALSPREPVDPDEVFVRYFADRYELSSRQIRSLRMILADEVADTKEILRANPEKLPPEVGKVRRRTEERIEVLLTAEQRVAYERDKQSR